MFLELNYWSIHTSRCMEWVYCWKIIQQPMLVVDNIHVKIWYTYTKFFHTFLKVVLVSCYQIVWMKKMYIRFHMFFKSSICFQAIKLFKCQKKYIWNAKHTIQHRMSVHKQPSVFNTTYTIQCRANWLYVFRVVIL